MNCKWGFDSFVEFYVVHLKKSRGENLIILQYHFNHLEDSFSYQEVQSFQDIFPHFDPTLDQLPSCWKYRLNNINEAPEF